MSRVALQASLPPDSARCGCASCGFVFTGITAFDAHRNRGRGKERDCQHPKDVGLVLTDRAEPVWGFPAPPEEERPKHWKKGKADGTG